METFPAIDGAGGAVGTESAMWPQVCAMKIKGPNTYRQNANITQDRIPSTKMLNNKCSYENIVQTTTLLSLLRPMPRYGGAYATCLDRVWAL